MGSIYSFATSTVIFVDSDDCDLDLIVREIKSISTSPIEWRIDSPPTPTKEISKIAVDPMNRILSSAWFTRVWILQELVLSRDPLIQCGRVRIRWNTFLSLALSLSKQCTLCDAFSTLAEMHTTRSKYHFTTEEGNTLSDLVLWRSGHGASDPRDIVFAHTGLSSDRDAVAPSITVVYTHSLAHVYAEITHHLLNNEINTFILLGNIERDERHSDLPSWVPDWSKSLGITKHNYWIGKYRFLESYRGQFKTCDFRAQNPILTKIPEGPITLSLKCCIVGEISHVRRPPQFQFGKTEGKSIAEYLWPEGIPDSSGKGMMSWEMPPESARRSPKWGSFKWHVSSTEEHQEVVSFQKPVFEHELVQGLKRLRKCCVTAIGLPEEAFIAFPVGRWINRYWGRYFGAGISQKVDNMPPILKTWAFVLEEQPIFAMLLAHFGFEHDNDSNRDWIADYIRCRMFCQIIYSPGHEQVSGEDSNKLGIGLVPKEAHVCDVIMRMFK
jgi:hypothetical protein